MSNESDNIRSDLPGWIQELVEYIECCWQHNGNGNRIAFRVIPNDKSESWELHASPSVQLIVNDEDKVGEPFIFEAGQFGQSPGVEIVDYSIVSECPQCRPSESRLVLKVRFQGHLVLIHIYVAAEHESVEIIDCYEEVPF